MNSTQVGPYLSKAYIQAVAVKDAFQQRNPLGAAWSANELIPRVPMGSAGNWGRGASTGSAGSSPRFDSAGACGLRANCDPSAAAAVQELYRSGRIHSQEATACMRSYNDCKALADQNFRGFLWTLNVGSMFAGGWGAVRAGVLWFAARRSTVALEASQVLFSQSSVNGVEAIASSMRVSG